jgi:predicted ATPase
MQISSVEVKAFKSIMDLEIIFDPQVTVIIGPNESGKTNILKAIEAFNPEFAMSKDLTCQYSTYFDEGKFPEITIEYSDIEPRAKAEFANIHHSLKDSKTIKIKKFGPTASDYQILLQDKEIAVPDSYKLFKFIPKNLYFDQIPLLKSMVRLQELEGADSRYKGERDLLNIGGISEYHEIFEDSIRGRRRREEASRFLTEQVREVWTQDPSLEFKFNVNGDVLHIDISDETTVFDSTETRSMGFWWFISFYVNFMTQTVKEKRDNTIYLIEEPGIHLHPSGQKDLVRLFEILSKKFQIVYTTHSPFMINRTYPQRVRLVSKTRKGTEVDNKTFRDNWKPLRNSIGLMIGDLFFFGDSGILLEMPTKKLPFMKKMRAMKLWQEDVSRN